MKILVVGATSSLAKSLIPALSEYAEVMTGGRKNADIYLDLLEDAPITLPEGIDIVINTAAHFGGGSDVQIYEAEKANVLGNLRLCQASLAARVSRYIYISSMSACLQPGDTYYGIYALSKRHAEEVTGYFCKLHNLPFTILRPSQIYGEDESFKAHQPYIYAAIENARNNRDTNIYGRHDALRNYIYVDDLVTIISKVISLGINGSFSVVNPINISYSDIAWAAIKAFNSKGQVRFLEDKPDIPDNIFNIDNILYEKIDYAPMISIEEGMHRIAKHKSLKT